MIRNNVIYGALASIIRSQSHSLSRLIKDPFLPSPFLYMRGNVPYIELKFQATTPNAIVFIVCFSVRQKRLVFSFEDGMSYDKDIDELMWNRYLLDILLKDNHIPFSCNQNYDYQLKVVNQFKRLIYD